MKQAYPIILTPVEEGGFLVYIPDFTINTQGETVEECMEMAIDAIGGVGMVRENENIPFPTPTLLAQVTLENPEDIVTLVSVDFDSYRKKVDSRTK